MYSPIKVSYDIVNTLDDLDAAMDYVSLAAFDFETASRYTAQEKFNAERTIRESISYKERLRLKRIISSNGLSHPSRSMPIVMSVAWNEEHALVYVFKDIADVVNILTWLTYNYVKQIWHNASFDFRHIYYYAKALPQNYEDTMLMVKTLTNNADSTKGLVGLKQLMGYKYGAWAESRDVDFTQESKNDPTMLLYAATDACATYSLYQDIILGKYGEVNNCEYKYL